uniref:Uncharacterized protein n=1 Tax=Anopheles culicifacies TaxID=139723 RepID=A0A182LYB6_9DIPT
MMKECINFRNCKNRKGFCIFLHCGLHGLISNLNVLRTLSAPIADRTVLQWDTLGLDALFPTAGQRLARIIDWEVAPTNPENLFSHPSDPCWIVFRAADGIHLEPGRMHTNTSVLRTVYASLLDSAKQRDGNVKIDVLFKLTHHRGRN